MDEIQIRNAEKSTKIIGNKKDILLLVNNAKTRLGAE